MTSVLVCFVFKELLMLSDLNFMEGTGFVYSLFSCELCLSWTLRGLRTATWSGIEYFTFLILKQSFPEW